MITKSVLAGSVAVGLRPIPGLRIVKRPAGMPNAKGNGIERNVKNGIIDHFVENHVTSQ